MQLIVLRVKWHLWSMSMKYIIKVSCVRSYHWTANWKSDYVSIMSQIISAFVCQWNDLSHSLFSPLIPVMPTGRREPRAGLSFISKSSRHTPTVEESCEFKWMRLWRMGLLLPTINVQMCKSGRICWVSCCLGSQWLAQHLPGLKKWAEHMYLWWGMRWMLWAVSAYRMMPFKTLCDAQLALIQQRVPADQLLFQEGKVWRLPKSRQHLKLL